jgi:protease I
MPDVTPLSVQRVLIFAGEDYEDLELWYPKLRLEEAGVHVTLAGPAADTVYPGKHGYPCQTDAAIDQMEAADFDGVVCPGGWMPDKLRRIPKVLDLLREFDSAGKLIAAICHGGWMPISAGIYEGVKTTGSPGIKDDLINAGAEWVDAEVVVDGHHVTSRRPADLPAFCREILRFLSGEKS